MGTKRLLFSERCANGWPQLVRAMAVLALFLSISPTSAGQDGEDDGPQEVPKTYGDSGFYVKLQRLSVSQGELDPSFSPNREKYTVAVENPNAKELLFAMELNIPKYDLMYPPKIEVNGKKVTYSPLRDITDIVFLNKTIGAMDQTVDITLSDPKPATGFFVGPGAKKTYKIRVLQPPEFDKVVEAQDITVKDAHTNKVIVARPAFNRTSSEVNYMYALDEPTSSIDLKVQCHKESTGLLINSEASGTSKKVDVKGDRTIILVQCLYHDHRWTHDHVLQRTYVLTFSRTSSLEDTKVDVRMQSDQGYCLQNDPNNMSMGWMCRSVEDHPNLVAISNNDKASLLLEDKAQHSHSQFRLPSGLPIKVPNMKSRDTQYELVMKAGVNSRRFDVTIMRPAPCTDVSCPVGSVHKSMLLESAYDHLCFGKECVPKDADQCCEEGTPHDVIVTSWGSTPYFLGKAVKKATGYSEEEVDALCQYGDRPLTIVSGVTGSVGESQAYILRKGGASAHTARTKVQSYTVMYAGSAGDHDMDTIVKAVVRGSGISFEKANDLVGAGQGTVKEDLDKSAAEKLLKKLNTTELRDAGGKVYIMEIYPRVNVWVDGFDPKLTDEQKEEVMQFLMEKTGLPEKSARLALAGIPNFVAGGLTPADAALLMALLKKYGAKAKVLPYEEGKLPYYLKGACKDPNSPMCGATASCDKYDCPEGKVGVVNGTCKSSACTDEDEDRCCGTSVLCSDYSCPIHWGKRLLPWGRKCAIQDVMQVCCRRSAMCDTFVCPQGYVLLDHASSLSCEDKTCDTYGKEICCAQVSVCSAFRCPDIMVPKPDAAKIFVDPLSSEACCDERMTCESFECGKGLARKKDAHLLLCNGTKCTDDDAQQCCEGAGSCFGFGMCPPHTTVVQHPGQVVCKESTCTATDTSSCCTKVSTCSSYPCPARYALKQNADFIDCLGPNCTSLDMRRCCESQAVCGAMSCPVHYGLIPHQADFTFCRGSKCTEADTDTCCTKQKPCSSLKVPDKFVLNSGANELWVNDWDKDKCWTEAATCQDFYGCPEGFTLKKRPWTILCSLEVCSDVDTGSCCEKEAMKGQRTRKPFTVTVTDEATKEECPHSTGQAIFWCKSHADKVSLLLEYKAEGEKAVTKPLTAVPVPSKDQGPKHITVILREPFIETTRINIWVYQGEWPQIDAANGPGRSRASEVDVTGRRLAEGAFSDQHCEDGGTTILFELGDISGLSRTGNNTLPQIWS